MKRKAYLYVRVSTDEQAEKGYSQKHQDDRLKQYCEHNDIEVAGIYWEDFSAKTFNRPEFNKLVQHLKKSKGSADLLLFLKWDRFSRNIAEAYAMINQLAKLGIEPQAIEQPLDLSIPENKIMLPFYLAAPEVENDRRSLNTIAGLRRAMKEGRHLNMAPKGYKNVRDENNNPIIVPSKDAPNIIWVFEEVARARHNVMDIWRMAKQKGLIVGKSQMWNIIKNPIYCGKIFIPAYKDEEATTKKATHEPIISFDLFEEVQDVLSGRKRKFPFKKTLREEFPLRGYLECHKCGNKLTASGSKGNGGKYFYYHCTKGCNERFKAEDANKAFIKKLVLIRPNEKSIKLLDLVIKNDRKPSDVKEKYNKELLADIEKYKLRIKNIQKKFADEEISSKDFNEMKSDYEADVRKIERELQKFDSRDTNFDTELKFCIEFLTHLPKYYDSADLIAKQQIIGSIFSEKLIFENNSFRTTKLNTAVELISRTGKHFREAKNEESPENSELSNLVPRTGIEPAHPCERQILSLLRLPIPPSGQNYPDNYREGCNIKSFPLIAGECGLNIFSCNNIPLPATVLFR